MEINITSAIEDLRVPSTHFNYQNGRNIDDDISCPPAKKVPPFLSDWTHYSTLISWIALELKTLCPEVDEDVTPPKTTSPDDLTSFKMELSSLLKELGFPYVSLLEPQLPARFESAHDRQILLNFLLSELQAARMIHVQKGKSGGGGDMHVSLDESPTAKILKEMMIELDLGKPPAGSTPGLIWTGILQKVKARNPTLEPLFTGALSDTQWVNLDNYFKELKSDYGMRREMLLKRLDVTVQSFHWSDRLKGDKEEKLNAEFRKLRPKMKENPAVELSHVLAARIDLPVVEKTSSSSVRKNTRSAVNSVVIGKVPDRGGRPDEVEPPPPEMPSWQQRQGAPAASSGWTQNPNQGGGGGRGGARGGGGGNRGGGGRVQGGWAPRGGGQGQQYQHGDNYQSQQQQQQFHQGGGGYNQGGGGGYSQGGGGGYNKGGGGYYQHDNRDNYDQQRGDNYQDQGFGHRGGRGGYQDNRGGRGGRGRDNRRY
ncbi:protein FAM98A [Folsomia candida]|uniref:protein FAM98A n=1 Tax=Folsomia candida TaxID=158441 RepID=UPI000B9069B1|nr:protein FAM98A [Folsomia candida]XP_035706669.1 protein FAM98A [Folsomia candida]XP_035706670.1 protein FAM98A [Folsomia candida]XP_035706671.1 protein FAM98A [Folsomia candida]